MCRYVRRAIQGRINATLDIMYFVKWQKAICIIKMRRGTAILAGA